jgi:hypothetical protein
MASTFGATLKVPLVEIGAPFKRNWFVPSRPPFMVKLPLTSQPRVPEKPEEPNWRWLNVTPGVKRISM